MISSPFTSLGALCVSRRTARLVHPFNSSDNSRIRTAATDVARHALAYLIVREFHAPRAPDVRRDVARCALFDFAQHPDRRTDLTGRAVAALETVVLDEGGLDGVEFSIRACSGETFDGCDFASVINYGEREARVDAPAVNEHRARAALAVIATLLRAG